MRYTNCALRKRQFQLNLGLCPLLGLFIASELEMTTFDIFKQKLAIQKFLGIRPLSI